MPSAERCTPPLPAMLDWPANTKTSMPVGVTQRSQGVLYACPHHHRTKDESPSLSELYKASSQAILSIFEFKSQVGLSFRHLSFSRSSEYRSNKVYKTLATYILKELLCPGSVDSAPAGQTAKAVLILLKASWQVPDFWRVKPPRTWDEAS